MLARLSSLPFEARHLVLSRVSTIGSQRPRSTRRSINSLSSFEQGSKPADSSFTRQYFYTIDEHGQLFLSDAKVKNFITAYKDKTFLDFFTKRIRKNDTGVYTDVFPYISPCGKELVCSSMCVGITLKAIVVCQCNAMPVIRLRA